MRLSRKRDRRRAGARAQPRRARRDHARTALHARYQRPLDRAALFGGDYNLPIGISPVGLVNALWPGADNMLAAAARAANVPYGLSTVGTTSIEASGSDAAPSFAIVSFINSGSSTASAVTFATSAFALMMTPRYD
ncbi:alpha-hydroxy-acid oxidizing protein [Neorhizobium galegae]